MRTDSPQVATGAIEEARAYIRRRFGPDYVPASARRYASKSKVAQEAHEAIRPTQAQRDPESLRAHLTREHFRLYELIWKRMVASQMADALLDSTQVDISAGGRSGQAYVFRVTGSVIKFPGFRTLYLEPRDVAAGDEPDDQERTLPDLKEGDRLQCLGLKGDQHFTEPPPRYTEGSLVRALEERGIGRPSTYAPIISTIVDRQYATREKGSLRSTRLGQVVNDQLMQHFPAIMDLDFTAQLEEQLDDVANGKQEWVPLLQEFYGPFTAALEKAQVEMPRVRVEEPTDEICELCGRPMVIKRGRFGPFLSCSGFPECRNARPLLQRTGVKCPKCATGELVQRRGKGRVFYGCSTYPNCDFTINQRPLREPCPECDGLMVASGRDIARCTNCAYQGDIPQREEAEAV
jgi:DNA topoisomerase-1